MAKQKLTAAEQAALRSDYEQWNPHDPNSITAAELAKKHGISKQTLYTYRDRWIDEDRREREKALKSGSAPPNESAEAILFLTVELARARATINELTGMAESNQQRISELEARLNHPQIQPMVDGRHRNTPKSPAGR